MPPCLTATDTSHSAMCKCWIPWEADLHSVQPGIGADAEPDPVEVSVLRPLFSRTLIAVGGFTRESAQRMLQSGHADLIAFGRAFMANPDDPTYRGGNENPPARASRGTRSNQS